MTQNYFDDTRAMSDLVEGFHVLGPRTPGARPWDPEAFHDFAERAYGKMSTGERLALSFVRDVWTMGESALVPRFRLDDALNSWDDRNLAHAFAWLDVHVALPARARRTASGRPGGIPPDNLLRCPWHLQPVAGGGIVRYHGRVTFACGCVLGTRGDEAEATRKKAGAPD